MNKEKMPMYIGTKLVQAKPMSLGEYNKRRSWPITGEDLCKDGYLVRYQPDGYESWSPKEVFEQAYRQVDGLSFGLAIEAAKKGKKITRKGWNGKGQYVVLGRSFSYFTDGKEIHDTYHGDIGSTALVFVGTRGSQVGWLASQSDMLADDWMLLPDCGKMSWPQAEAAIKEGKAVCRLADDWDGVHFVGLIEEPEELAGKVCKVMKDGTIYPDWEPTPDDLTGSDWFEVYLPGKEN